MAAPSSLAARRIGGQCARTLVVFSKPPNTSRSFLKTSASVGSPPSFSISVTRGICSSKSIGGAVSAIMPSTSQTCLRRLYKPSLSSPRPSSSSSASGAYRSPPGANGRHPGTSARNRPGLVHRQQGRIPARGGEVSRDRALGREAVQVARAAGFWPGCGKPLPAKRLCTDDGADHVPVDVGIADPEPSKDALDGGLDAAVDTERQRVARRLNLVEHRIEPVCAPADDVQYRAEDLIVQPAGAVDLEGAR